MSCCCDKFPNVVLVYVVDEDSVIQIVEDSYLQLFQDSQRTITSQTINYCSDLFTNANLEGFVGVVLVPVISSEQEDHDAMLQRMNQFKNSMPSGYSDKIIITQEVDRNSDYSQILIDSIESLRYIDDSENPIEIDYIITDIDDSGSHNGEDFDLTFLNYYRQYSTDISYQSLLSLNMGSDYVRELTTVNRQLGLVVGIGTKHIIKLSPSSNNFRRNGENWMSAINDFLMLIASYIGNFHRIKNCELLCRQRYTTAGGNLLYPIAPDSFTTDSAGILEYRGSILLYIDGEDSYQQLSGFGPDYDIWSILYDGPSVSDYDDLVAKNFYWPYWNSADPPNYFGHKDASFFVTINSFKFPYPVPNNPYIDSKLIVPENIIRSLSSYRQFNLVDSQSCYCECNQYYPLNQYYRFQRKA